MAVIPLRPRNTEELLERIAQRLVTLLNESEDPRRDMNIALGALEESGLWNGPMDASRLDHGQPKFTAFAHNLISGKAALVEVLAMSAREFEPIYCESVEELINALLPSDGHLD